MAGLFNSPEMKKEAQEILRRRKASREKRHQELWGWGKTKPKK